MKTASVPKKQGKNRQDISTCNNNILQEGTNFKQNSTQTTEFELWFTRMWIDHSHKWIYKEPNEQEINFLSAWNNSADSVSYLAKHHLYNLVNRSKCKENLS